MHIVTVVIALQEGPSVLPHLNTPSQGCSFNILLHLFVSDFLWEHPAPAPKAPASSTCKRPPFAAAWPRVPETTSPLSL